MRVFLMTLTLTAATAWGFPGEPGGQTADPSGIDCSATPNECPVVDGKRMEQFCAPEPIILSQSFDRDCYGAIGSSPKTGYRGEYKSICVQTVTFEFECACECLEEPIVETPTWW